MSSDELLETIAKLGLEADRSSESSGAISVILQCGGLLISGQIITERDFILANPVTELVDMLPPEFRDRVTKTPLPLRESLEKELSHLHLKNARFVVPGGKPWPDEGAFWRVRLDRV